MSIFRNGLRTINILGKAASNFYAPGDGWSVMGAVDTHERGTIVMDFPVRAGSSTIAAWFEGGLINFGTSPGDTGDILTSLSVRRYVGGVASGSYTNVCTNATVKEGQTYTSAPINLTVTAGETLRVDCWGAAEVGKFLPGTQQANPPALGETGDTLVFTGDGSANDAISDGTFVWIWGMGLGKSRAEAMAAVGHSMIPATHNKGDSAQSLAADALEVPYCGFGAGGSLPDALDDDGDWDQILVMGQRVLIQWMVNACNNFAGNATLDAITGSAIPTYSGGVWTTSMAALLERVLKRYVALGCKCYVCTENYPGDGANPTATARRLHVWNQWNEWLVNSGPTYYGYLLEGVIDTRPAFATQPYEAGVPVSGGSTDIHSNYAFAATEIEAAFSSGGAFEDAFTPDNNNYVEAFYQLFHGVSGTPGAAGALPTGWAEWYFTTEAPRLAVNGKSCLRVVSPTTKTTYAICDTPVGGSNATVEFTVSAYSTVWTAQSNNQGLHIGLHATSGATVNNNSAASFHREGYSFTWSNNGSDLRLHFRRYNPNAIQTSEGLGLTAVNQVRTMTGLAIAAGEVLTVHITRTYTGGNNAFTFLTYVDGALIDTWTNTDTTISANAAVQALYDGLLYVSLGTAGDTSTTHTNGTATWDAIRAYNYDATVIAALAGPATLYVVQGGSSPVDVDVTQSAPTAGAAVGVVVTTSLAGLTGATIGSAETTDGAGTARFSGGNALSIPDTLAVGTTGTLTVTCGGVSEDIPVEVIAEAGSGSGGGARVIFGGYLQ
jgi:hypothetical protein